MAGDPSRVERRVLAPARGVNPVQTVSGFALSFPLRGAVALALEPVIQINPEPRPRRNCVWGRTRDTAREMSQENLETARRWLEAISGGSEDFDGALGLVHRDIVLVPPGDQPPYRGADSLRRWMEPDAFQEQVVKAFDPVAITERTILGRQHITARGMASGIELDTVTWSVWTFDEDGLITRIEIYLDHEKGRALKAAGLSEKAISEGND
jgi:ketosteroid isomerase-like protein